MPHVGELKIRLFTPRDKKALDAVLEANTPRFFSVKGAEKFTEFLNSKGTTQYWVVSLSNEKIIAGGGGEFAPKAFLKWGMVHPDWHLKGIGSLLVAFRLLRVMKDKAIKEVCIEASQHNSLFYARFGFITEDIKENYYAKGLHLYNMRLVLQEKNRQAFEQKLKQILVRSNLNSDYL